MNQQPPALPGGALVVEVDGRVLRLDPSRPVHRIGRSIEAEVVLSAGSVSRQHAELRVTPRGWVLVDNGSQFGTSVDGQPVKEFYIDRRVAITCGPPGPGTSLTAVPAEQYAGPAAAPVAPAPVIAPPPAAASPFAPPAPGAPAPGVPAPGAPGPGAPVGARPAGAGAPLPAGSDETVVLAGPTGPPGSSAPRTGPDLLLVAEGAEYRFRHPAQLTVGRRADCAVVLTDPAASRLHGRVDAVPGGWTYTNLSDEGTYDDGKRITSQRFDERTVLRLGHPVAGPELTLVPVLSAAEEERRFARRRLRRRLNVLGAVAAVLLVVGGLVTLSLVRGDDEPAPAAGTEETPRLSPKELEAAKAATVKISAETVSLADPSQGGSYSGSGSIIRADGLILTNAHVAEPEADGLAQTYGDIGIANPEYLMISLTDGATDKNAPPAYRARVVEADGFLDIAVIQIFADADGQPLDGPLDLPTVPIGTSKDLRAGDDITILGFPGVAGSSDAITVTKGVVSTIINDEQLGPRSEIDTDARIAPGNSGGMAVGDDGDIIGIPTALRSDQSTPVTSGRVRTIDAVKDVIKKAEAEAKAP